MRFDYDPETDSLYIKLAERPGFDGSEVAPGVVFDYDAGGQVVGIDIEYASQIAGFGAILRGAQIRQSRLAVAA
jgi:uncharacterized protein YuzE